MVKHDPREKYRAVFFLDGPIKITDLAARHEEALAVFKRKILGMGEMVGVHVDPACVDPSRLFFTPRRRAGTDPYIEIVRGRALRWDEIVEVEGGRARRGGSAEPVLTPGGVDLRFTPRASMELAEFLRSNYPADMVRGSSGEKQFVECPNAGRHGQGNDTDCFASDGDGDVPGSWHCSHGSCANDGTLERIRDAMIAGHIDEDQFFLPVQEGGAIIMDDEEYGGYEVAIQTTTTEGADALAAKLDENAGDQDLVVIINHFLASGDNDSGNRARLIDAIVKSKAPHGRRAVAALWKKAVSDARSITSQKVAGDRMLVGATDSHMMICNTIADLRDMNGDSPCLFHVADTLATIRNNADGDARLDVFDGQGRLEYIINERGLFVKDIGNADAPKFIKEFAPERLVKHLWNSEFPKFALPLRGLKTTPFFGRDGGIVSQNGYDPASKIFLAMPEGAALDSRVSGEWNPSRDDVYDAVDMLLDVFADFPLDGMTRAELEAAIDKGEDVPSFSALLGMVMLPFMREMIDGPTPGHFLTKPAAGTGASLLMETASFLTVGRESPAMTLPENREEVDKTLSTIIAEGREYAYFDNINHSVNSGTLASAITARRWMARILGKSQTKESEVRCVWVFTGNNVTMTGELLRRCIPILLDAKSTDPTSGRNFKYRDIRAHVAANRWGLVSAVLTLIQNWKVRGCPEFTGKPLASFEDWSRKIGGVLECADLRGFMSNIDEWKDAASDDKDDGLLRLMAALAEYPVGTVYRPSGTEAPTNAATGKREEGSVVSIMDVLNKAGGPETDDDPILLNGWSYRDDYDGGGRTCYVYSNSGQIGKRFRASARIPYAIGCGDEKVIFQVQERQNKKNNGKYWVRIDTTPSKT